MCNIGSVVHRDCSGDSSTTCIPCSSGTFMNAPNGLYKCLTCKNCSKSKGIYILSPCNTIKDTVCDVLDGYYCVEYSNSQCQLAQKHSVCKQGNETKASGTKSSDTKCEACPFGFYSPTGLKCIRWTDCAAKNEIETEAGSSIKDVTCTKRRSRYCLTVPVSAFVLSILGCIWMYLKSTNKKQVSKPPIEETTPHTHCNTTHQTPEEHKEEEETPVVSSPPSVGTSTDHKQVQMFLPT